MSEVDPLSRQLLVEFKVDPLRLLVTGSRPCQHTPRPVFGSPGPDGGAGGCRNRQTNAHITETREVCYPWHPWYGRAVAICAVLTKRHQAVVHCRLEPDEGGKALEVPQWMFEQAGCCTMQLVQAPQVKVRPYAS